MRGRRVALFVTLAVVTACADSRDAQPDDTLPRITSDSTPTTTLAPPVTAAPTTVAPTAPPTAAPTPAPTVAPTAAPTVAPTAAPTTRPAGPTSTLVLTPGAAVECTAPALGADTGVEVDEVACRGGWAIGHTAACDPAQGCADVEVFHVAGERWVHDGAFAANCAEALARAGMTLHTAIAFQAPPCDGDPGTASNILPGSTGTRVTQLQIALVALGYDLAIDGRYGPRTQAAVRDVQARNGLEVDAIAGPSTQEVLGIGPGAAPAATVTAPTTATTTTAAPGPSTSVVIAAGEPVACSVSAIGADTGRFGGDVRCVGGWAVVCPRGEADCSTVDVFHVTDRGWVYDVTSPRSCVDDLTVTGMSVHTAAEFAELCADGLPVRENVLPGSTGPEVEQVQIALVALGYPLVVDGTYGPRTEAAVRDVQARNDLEVDGIAGPDTQTALGI